MEAKEGSQEQGTGNMECGAAWKSVHAYRKPFTNEACGASIAPKGHVAAAFQDRHCGGVDVAGTGSGIPPLFAERFLCSGCTISRLRLPALFPLAPWRLPANILAKSEFTQLNRYDTRMKPISAAFSVPISGWHTSRHHICPGCFGRSFSMCPRISSRIFASPCRNEGSGDRVWLQFDSLPPR